MTPEERAQFAADHERTVRAAFQRELVHLAEVVNAGGLSVDEIEELCKAMQQAISGRRPPDDLALTAAHREWDAMHEIKLIAGRLSFTQIAMVDRDLQAFLRTAPPAAHMELSVYRTIETITKRMLSNEEVERLRPVLAEAYAARRALVREESAAARGR